MQTQKSLPSHFAEWWDQRQIERQASTGQTTRQQRLAHWMPNRGSVIFILLVAGLLLWAQTAGALPLPGYRNAPEASSTGTIAYQGRLADADGTPLTSTVNMEFRLYNAATGGTPLWSELWTGANAVQVSDGLFNVMLGSLEPIPQSIVTGNVSLWLGITAGTDDEMLPRVQLGSVPFAMVASQTLEDRSQTWVHGPIVVGGQAGSVSEVVRWTFPHPYQTAPVVVGSVSENYYCYYCSVRIVAVTPQYADFVLERHVSQGTPPGGGTGYIWAIAEGS